MKVYLIRDEYAPFYDIYSVEYFWEGALEVDLPAGFVEGFNEVMERLGKMQEYLEKLYEEKKGEEI